MTDAPASPRHITAYWLGRMRYDEALALQEHLVKARIAGEIGDTLLLVEHERVITLGRGAHLENVLVDMAEREARGIDYAETGRGGDVTYHGPGQLVGYPIFDLKPERCDVRKYVRDLARTMILTAADFGVSAGFIEGDAKLVGVWVDPADPARFPEDPRSRAIAKIGAIGVRLSRWVTMHGFAFNVAPELADYAMIVACGITRYGVTSLAALAAPGGTAASALPTVEQAGRRAAVHLAELFSARLDFADREATQALVARPSAAASAGVSSAAPQAKSAT
jgi:lipoyl(octanoyl) transferase